MLSHFSCVWLFVNLWTVAHQAPLSRQEHWSGLPGPPPGDPPDPGIEPAFPVAPALQADSFTTEPRKPLFIIYKHFKLLLQEHWSQYLVYYTVRKGSLIAVSLLHLLLLRELLLFTCNSDPFSYDFHLFILSLWILRYFFHFILQFSHFVFSHSLWLSFY